MQKLILSFPILSRRERGGGGEKYYIDKVNDFLTSLFSSFSTLFEIEFLIAL